MSWQIFLCFFVWLSWGNYEKKGPSIIARMHIWPWFMLKSFEKRYCLSVSWINLGCFNPLQCWDRAKRTINYASNIPIERVLLPAACAFYPQKLLDVIKPPLCRNLLNYKPRNPLFHPYLRCIINAFSTFFLLLCSLLFLVKIFADFWEICGHFSRIF